MRHKQHVIQLFNNNVLTMVSVRWYTSQGYAFICKGGKVIDIVQDEP